MPTWKPIPDHPLYRAGSDGRIISDWGDPPRTMKPYRFHRTLYLTLTAADGTRTQATVHSLVAAAFHGPKPDGQVIRHIDGNHDNNAADNLEYTTHSELAKNARAARKGKPGRRPATRCKNGHKYTPGTTYTRKDGTRECRICRAQKRLEREGRSAMLLFLDERDD